jgi:hypothetical protein
VVFEAHDAAFAKVGAALNLAYLHKDLAWVGEGVLAAQGVVVALVFAYQRFYAVFLFLVGAAHHDQVFWAVVVHLQSEAGDRDEHDFFHLPTLAFADAIVASPG